MQIIPIYKYRRNEGGVTVSPIQPDTEYTQMQRVVADEGKLLRLRDGTTACCADVESTDGITEETDPGFQIELLIRSDINERN